MKKIITLAGLLLGMTLHAQPGTLDGSFGTGGKVVVSVSAGADIAYAVALQSDGKILVAGTATNADTGKDFTCLRYNTNGTLDTTFGTNGIRTIDMQVGSDDVAYAIAVQADGKIILAGYADNGSNKNAAMIRLNTNGTTDLNFGNFGKVFTDFISTRADEIKCVKIHGLTGNIIVGGTSAVTSTNATAIIARYNSDGILDTTFGTTGIISNLPNGSGVGTYYYVIEDLAVKPNGKISAVGWLEQQGLSWSSNYYSCKLNSNGTADTTFSGDGVLVANGPFNGNDRAYSMILNADDSMTYGGGAYVTTLEYDFTVGNITATGSAATLNQVVAYGNDLYKDIAYGIAKDAGDKYILAGVSGLGAATSFGVACLNADYSPYTAFDGDGKLTTTFGSSTVNGAYDLVIQPDYKIVAVGFTGNDIAIARYIGSQNLAVDQFASSKTTVYPNPSKEYLKIESGADLAGAEYAITDLNGRQVASGMMRGNEDNIATASLQNGVYLLTIAKHNIAVKFVKI